MLALVTWTAFLLDRCLGEPRYYHPLVGFGSGVARAEQLCRWLPVAASRQGLIAAMLVLTPLLLAGLCIEQLKGFFYFCLSAPIVYFCIALRSLDEHARAVAGRLFEGDIGAARTALARIVSRDCQTLNECDIARASCESVLENGSDGVFAALFWFLVAGVPGVLVYRGANTLDAMWGYRNERYRDFGRFAARLDDLLNWLPARLAALSYALLGDFQAGLHCWRHQAHRHDSPNGGPVMAAGAGALGLQLGGAASYHGEIKQRPLLGCGREPLVADILRALSLVHRTALLWLLVIALGTIV